jgi:hypothetical protein
MNIDTDYLIIVEQVYPYPNNQTIPVAYFHALDFAAKFAENLQARLGTAIFYYRVVVPKMDTTDDTKRRFSEWYPGVTIIWKEE